MSKNTQRLLPYKYGKLVCTSTRAYEKWAPYFHGLKKVIVRLMAGVADNIFDLKLVDDLPDTEYLPSQVLNTRISVILLRPTIHRPKEIRSVSPEKCVASGKTVAAKVT